MSLAAFLNHTVDVYRKSSGAWSISGIGLKAAVQRRSDGAKATPGEGQQYAASIRIFMLAAADVQEGDIIEVASGPGSFGHLFVEGVYLPRNHHAEVTATEVMEDPTA